MDVFRRLSWSGALLHDHDGVEEDEVEVVELFSATTTSETIEQELPAEKAPISKKKKRQDDDRSSMGGGGEDTVYVIEGDVNLKTSPTKKRRILSQSIVAMETLIEVIADEEEVLSTRLEYCSNLWRFVREMHSHDVVEFVRQRSSSVVRVIETLLHTGYFPLQQLCFMTVAAILRQLHKKETDMLAAFVVACNQSLNEQDVGLLDLLPLREAIAWHDPRVARQRIVQINRRTGLCHSFRVARCWVSPNGKKDLARIRVNKWVDIGSTTTTFYWRDQNDVVVVNVPHSCVENVEIERENCVLYIWTKHIDRLKGVRLLALASTESDFPGLVKALAGVEIEGYTDTPLSPSQADAEFGSPIQTMKTASTLVLAGADPAESPRPQSPATTVDDSTAFEPDAVDPSSPTSDDSPMESLDVELSARLEAASRHAADSLDSLHHRLDAGREALTDSFSRISSAHLESHDELAKQEYELKATADELQKKRLLDLPNAEFIVEDRIVHAANEAATHMEDALDYAAEHVLEDGPDLVFTSASIVMLLIVVLPWVLFAVLHSGSDLGSVRQFAKDALVVLDDLCCLAVRFHCVEYERTAKRRTVAALTAAAAAAAAPMDLRALEEELKKLGVSIVSSRQETVISIRIKGLAGKALDRGLRLCDQLLQEKVKNVLKACTDPSAKLFIDPTFGPSADDLQGAAALCKTGTTIPSKGGSQHQMKVLGLLKADKLRWERPEYAVDDEVEAGTDNQEDNDDEADQDDESSSRSIPQERVFASDAKLFSDGVCSGDVIQGNLGDCWFLSALSVVATRSDLLEQTFWRGDKSKSKGLFVCKFMKNFVWNYVIIDDRLPIYGFSKTKEGKPYFARCRDPNELWVSLLEKAYAKLHGSYEALIGGFVDVALNDLTGMCSEQVIMKPGYPGFGEDPFAPAKPQQQRGDPFWEKILRYKTSGTLMGCSIQPAPTSADKSAAPESSAGNGLYFKHAYALVDAANVKTMKQDNVKLVKLRNPWGMGEWTGPWSDSSEERTQNQDVIEQFFKILKRRVGGNLSKQVFLSLNGKGELTVDEISQEEVIDVNANDGTFFMSYDAWMQYFTHFFAGIDFPDEWHGRRVEGCWNDANCGGNTTKSTWINNPRFEFVVQERSTFFISLSQEDPRGKENLKIVPIGFHICSLTSSSEDKVSKCEIKEPAGKEDTYYRLYKEKDRVDFKKGIRPEQLPPAIIPGSVIKGVDEDGVPQPAYTFKQAVSVDVTMEPGKYCILPSMYMRTDKDTGKTNVGSFWVSVYSNKPKFSLEGGERIVEEEEGADDDAQASSSSANGSTPPKSIAGSFAVSRRTSLNSPGKKVDSSVAAEAMSAVDRRRRFEDAKDELLAQAKAKGIGLRQLKMEFAKGGPLKKLDVRKKMLSMGFKADELSDEKINVIFSGLDEASKGSIESESILNLFEAEIQEDQMACEIPEVEDEEVPEKIHDEGFLSLELRGARDLPVSKPRVSRSTNSSQRTVVRLPAIEFTAAEARWRRACAIAVSERNPALAAGLRPVLRRNGWLPASMKVKPRTSMQGVASSPVEAFYEALENEMKTRTNDAVERSSKDQQDASLGHGVVSSSTIISLATPSKAASAAHAATQSSTKLHNSNRMQALEEKRCRRLGDLQRKKQETLGDRSKAASLPRLIGGRKSGSTFVQCSDCSRRVLVPGRAGEAETNSRTSAADSSPSFVCAGSRCFSALCSACYWSLPKGKQVCEDCYEHELTTTEAFGSQLRALLIEKLGPSSDQRAQVGTYFASMDKDKSGALSYDEFSSALASFGIQPALTDVQIHALMQQFDTNKDGDISLAEFKDWLFKDQVWQPDTLAESRTDQVRQVVTPEIRSEVIAPILDALLDAAFEAYLVSASTTQWVTTSNALAPHSMRATVLSDAHCRQETELGSILFQRVQTLKMAAFSDVDNAGSTENSIDEVFARYDADGSGHIDPREFRELLSALGMHLSESDAGLLMRRVESAASLNETLDLAEFRAYVENLMSGRQRSEDARSSLVAKLLKVEAIAASDFTKRETLQELFQQFHWNMRESQAARLRTLLRRRVGICFEVQEIQRLSNAFHFREVVPTSSSQQAAPTPQQSNTTEKDTLLELNNSGDVLSTLLFTNSVPSLSAQLKTFSLSAICGQIGAHLEDVTKTSSADGIWKTLFGGAASTSQPVDQREFLDKLLLSGFSVVPAEGTSKFVQRLSTKTLAAIALDALRCEGGEKKANDETSWCVTFNLFAVLLQYSKIDAIETKFTHALRSYLQFCQGNQNYLVEVAVEQDNLVVRAMEPARKYQMDFVLRPEDYTRLAISQLSSEIWSRVKSNSGGGRHGGFAINPYAVITDTTFPRLNNALLGLISRLRISIQDAVSSQHTMTPFLTLVEDAAFLQTLETMFARARLPFFWSVSPTKLEFSIDGDYLSQMKRGSFHQLIAETLSTKPAAKPLHSLLKFTNSSLSVRYEIIGQNAVFQSSWSDFQALLSGHQSTFAVLEVRPQGSSFMTKIDRSGGNGAPKWNLKQTVALKEPERSDHRLDRPVVYSDTVRVSSIPDSSSTKRISFAALNSDGGKQTSSAGHFVVLSVRKALPEKKSDQARLYCTAYDPFTSCDFAVEGYPADWAPTFFNAASNPDFEAQWLELVKSMYLGATLTPKVVVQVFAKHAKVEKLIGECEISVSSAIAHEGHVFDDWFPLLHPSAAGVTTGAINVAFTFDAKKTSEPSATAGTIIPRATSDEKPVKANEQRAAAVSEPNERDRQKLRDLEAALEQSEIAKRDALEQARKLKAQLIQQSSTPAPRNTFQAEESNEVARWKSKLEQVRRDQEAEQTDHDKRLAALQAELRRLEQDRVHERTQAVELPQKPAVATNLKQAALSDSASVHDILSAMKDILTHRSPDRPYNGLKKAMAAVADLPGKVSVAAFDDALDDFGLSLSTAHRKTLLSILDPEAKGRVNIEDFFIKLCGDADGNPVIPLAKSRSTQAITPRSLPTPEPSPPKHTPLVPPPGSPTRASISHFSTLPGPSRPPKMSWKEMKKFLLLNLPEGWETRFTEKGRPYFCNHANRSTQWKHPSPEVEIRYSEWIKENGANFQRLSSTGVTPMSAMSSGRK